MYEFRQTLDRDDKWLFYADFDKLMKDKANLEGQINYKLLKAQSAQQTLKLLDKDIKSFYKSIKAWKANPDKFKAKPELPHYKKRGAMFELRYTNQCSSIRDGKLKLGKGLEIDIPQWEKYGERLQNFQQVRIKPGRKSIKVEIVYVQTDIKPVGNDKYASIDLGLDNLATMVCEEGAFIYSGKFLKSYNNHFNKRLSALQSIKDKQDIKSATKRIKNMYERRERYMEDAFHKISRSIVDFLTENQIGNLVVGYNKDWKQNINIGKANNQKFVQMPFARLRSYLKYKCEMSGIRFICNEESYTSKCDSLAYEPVGKHETYLGKRVKRGLFRSSVGKMINADVNGALNILRKVVGDSEIVSRIIDSGLLLSPIRCNNPFVRNV
jgi:IS605 OrfB family transposase